MIKILCYSYILLLSLVEAVDQISGLNLAESKGDTHGYSSTSGFLKELFYNSI
jgi:hypothetical protein